MPSCRLLLTRVIVDTPVPSSWKTVYPFAPVISDMIKRFCQVRERNSRKAYVHCRPAPQGLDDSSRALSEIASYASTLVTQPTEAALLGDVVPRFASRPEIVEGMIGFRCPGTRSGPYSPVLSNNQKKREPRRFPFIHSIVFLQAFLLLRVHYYAFFNLSSPKKRKIQVQQMTGQPSSFPSL